MNKRKKGTHTTREIFDPQQVGEVQQNVCLADDEVATTNDARPVNRQHRRALACSMFVCAPLCVPVDLIGDPPNRHNELVGSRLCGRTNLFLHRRHRSVTQSLHSSLASRRRPTKERNTTTTTNKRTKKIVNQKDCGLAQQRQRQFHSIGTYNMYIHKQRSRLRTNYCFCPHRRHLLCMQA